MSNKEIKMPKNCSKCGNWHTGTHQVCAKCLKDECSTVEKISAGVKLEVFSF